MRIAITQPTFIPWIGYFELVARSDVFVFLDNVQFEKQSWQSRNRLRDKAGNMVWISLPVQKTKLATKIVDIEISEHPPQWRRKGLQTVSQLLCKYPCFDEIEELIQEVFEPKYNKLADLNIAFIKSCSERFGFETEFVRASDLTVEGRREDLVLEICKYFDANLYYSNAGSASYLEECAARFEAEGIELKFQNWDHPEYWHPGAKFVSHLSVLDGLAAEGFSELAKLIIPNQ